MLKNSPVLEKIVDSLRILRPQKMWVIGRPWSLQHPYAASHVAPAAPENPRGRTCAAVQARLPSCDEGLGRQPETVGNAIEFAAFCSQKLMFLVEFWLGFDEDLSYIH